MRGSWSGLCARLVGRMEKSEEERSLPLLALFNYVVLVREETVGGGVFFLDGLHGGNPNPRFFSQCGEGTSPPRATRAESSYIRIKSLVLLFHLTSYVRIGALNLACQDLGNPPTYISGRLGVWMVLFSRTSCMWTVYLSPVASVTKYLTGSGELPGTPMDYRSGPRND